MTLKLTAVEVKSNIPERLVPRFVGQNAFLTNVYNFLERTPDYKGDGQRNVLVIWGMGGLGKSQIALHLAQTAKEQYGYRGLFWVDASHGRIGFLTVP